MERIHKVMGAKVGEKVSGDVYVATLGNGNGHWDPTDPRVEWDSYGITES